MSDAAGGSSRGTRWEGFSNYEQVSKRISTSVDDAVDAYSTIQAAHVEDTAIPPDLASEARSLILSAAMRLMVEMESDREAVDVYDTILSRWEDGDDRTETGYVAEFQDVRLAEGVPGWLFQFVKDIRRAAWELGYLQAGRTSRTDPEDPDEAEVENMFDDL